MLISNPYSSERITRSKPYLCCLISSMHRVSTSPARIFSVWEAAKNGVIFFFSALRKILLSFGA